MKKNVRNYLMVLFIVMSMFLTVSCGSKKVVEADSVPVPAEEVSNSEVPLASDLVDGIIMQGDVYFNFDESLLTPEAQVSLTQKAAVMLVDEEITVVIEGHCDERGTNDYNLALGERRALAAKAFLVDLGVASNRMDTVTYGEERSVDPRHNQEAWAKNRRAHFVVY